MSADDLAGMEIDENEDQGGRTTRRRSRVSYVEAYIPEVDTSEDEGPSKGGKKKPIQKPKQKGRTKECPGCSAHLSTATKECTYCDYQFSSKSMLITQSMMVEESDMIRDKFPFEPEREEDGSLIIQNILGRRQRKSGRRWERTGSDQLCASDAKYDYEYLIKFKGCSYIHTQWLPATEIEAMNLSSKKSLMRYLTRLDRGDPECPDEADIDLSWMEVEKILDVREEEVMEVVDEPTVPVVEVVVPPTEILEHRTRLGAKSSSDELKKENGPLSLIPMLVKSEGGSSTTDLLAAQPTEELTGLAKWQADNQRITTKIWNPLERCKQLLARLCEDSYCVSFYEPVDTEVYDDYLDIIETPMCLSMIQQKFEKNEYKGFNFVSKFMNDVRTIWRNCKSYNLYKSQIWHTAHVMQMMSERLYQSWLVSFQEGTMHMTDPLARPWESTCRVCEKDTHEDKIILCDHCDAQYHIFCLSPPLKIVPEGIWICDRCSAWLGRTSSRLLSASAEDEARLSAENAGQRTVIKVKKKKYLVKWRNLSYRDCTWETAPDINEDVLIENYHKMNDSPPDEPPLTQAELGFELSKEKKLFIFPAYGAPNKLVDVQAMIYAQIRSYHFLKWDKIVPAALLHESGRSSYAYTLGMRLPQALPSSIRAAVEHYAAKSHNKCLVNDVDAMDIDKTGESKHVAIFENEGLGLGVSKDAVSENVSNPLDPVSCENTEIVSNSIHPSIEVSTTPITTDNTIVPTISESSDDVHLSLTWSFPKSSETIRTEVASVLSNILYGIAHNDMEYLKSDLIPKLQSFEIDVVLPKANGGLHMNIGHVDGRVVVMGFRATPSGEKSRAESCGKIRIGDLLVAVNGFYINKMAFKDVSSMLSKMTHPFIYLRFLRTPPHDRYKYDTFYLGERILQPLNSRLLGLRSKYFGVYAIGDGTFSAEVIHEYTGHSAGIFSNEIDAARAYDELALSLKGESALLNFTREDPDTLTNLAVSLAANVEYEMFTDRKRRIALSASALSQIERTSKFKYKHHMTDFELQSFDSLDSDSDLEDGMDTQQIDEELPPINSDDSENDDYDDEELEAKKKDERVKQLFESEGQMSRLIRAVNECDFGPKTADWEEYIIDQAKRELTKTSALLKRVEQYDLANNFIRVWDSIAGAARGCGTHFQYISACVNGRQEDAGGFKWRFARPIQKLGNVDDDDESKEDNWQDKLHKTTKDYKNGGNLRDYQLLGLNWLLRCWYTKKSSILADEMGLGKTVQVVSFLDHLFEVENIRGPFLVCVPLSTLEHWKREAEGWSNMQVCMYHDTGGGKDMRDAIREYEWYFKGRSRRLLKFNLLITTYDDLIKDYEDMAEIPWRAVVVDEAHRLKNINSKLLECMRSVVAKGQIAYGYQHRVLMTGTPLQNNTAELWSLLNFIEPAKFPDAETFSKRYGSITTQEQVEGLQRRIAPHLLRRVKEDVAKDIPPKEETIIDVELTTIQKQYYRAIFERNHGFLMQTTKGALPKLMNIQMELRKCCNHPFLISGVEEKELEPLENEFLGAEHIRRDDDYNSRVEANILAKKEFNRRRINECMIPTSGKMVLLDKLLPKLKKEGHKVLIFSQMVRMIDMIEEFCECRTYPCERLDGKVRGNDRQKAIDRFNTNVDSFVFLLSTRAGGVGINLTAADTVIIFDSDWNPQNDVQAMARCHRIGQKKQVTVYRLITRRSFEAEMFHRASRKLGLEQAVLGSRTFNQEEVEDQQNTKIDAKEMEQLLREGAYAVLLEDNADDMNAFIEQDIDTILNQRAHTIITEGAKPTESWLNKKEADTKKSRAKKSVFTGDSSTEFAEIDVNDPDFWIKVLPDLVTPSMMLARLMDLKEREDGAEPGLGTAVKKFMKDMSQMMNGILDLERRGQLPDHEKATCVTLLLRLTMKDTIFNEVQLSQGQTWLSIMEGSRKRLGRASFGGGGRGVEERAAYGSSGRGRGRGRGRGWSERAMASAESDDDDTNGVQEPRKRTGGTVGRGSRGGPGARLRAKEAKERERGGARNSSDPPSPSQPMMRIKEKRGGGRATGGAIRSGGVSGRNSRRHTSDDDDNEEELSKAKRKRGRMSSSHNFSDDDEENEEEEDEGVDDDTTAALKQSRRGRLPQVNSSMSKTILLQQQILRGNIASQNDDVEAANDDEDEDPYSSTFL